MKTFEQFIFEHYTLPEYDKNIIHKYFLEISHLSELKICFNFIDIDEGIYYFYKDKIFFFFGKKTNLLLINKKEIGERIRNELRNTNLDTIKYSLYQAMIDVFKDNMKIYFNDTILVDITDWVENETIFDNFTYENDNSDSILDKVEIKFNMIKLKYKTFYVYDNKIIMMSSIISNKKLYIEETFFDKLHINRRIYYNFKDHVILQYYSVDDISYLPNIT